VQYGLNSVKSAVKLQPTNQPGWSPWVCVRQSMWGCTSCCVDWLAGCWWQVHTSVAVNRQMCTARVSYRSVYWYALYRYVSCLFLQQHFFCVELQSFFV